MCPRCWKELCNMLFHGLLERVPSKNPVLTCYSTLLSTMLFSMFSKSHKKATSYRFFQKVFCNNVATGPHSHNPSTLSIGQSFRELLKFLSTTIGIPSFLLSFYYKTFLLCHRELFPFPSCLRTVIIIKFCLK